MEIVSVILAVVVVTITAIKNKGIPDSVSEIAYIIPHLAFSMWIAMVGGFLMPSMMEHLSENMQFIGFLTVVGMLCVAASSYYRTEAAPLHYIGGIMCAICATIVTATIDTRILLIWIVYVFQMFLFKFKNWCFWGEVFVYGLLIYSLIR